MKRIDFLAYEICPSAFGLARDYMRSKISSWKSLAEVKSLELARAVSKNDLTLVEAKAEMNVWIAEFKHKK